MAISSGGGADTPMADINTTPLVDVMLVLLIIFLIAVPVAIQTIEKLEIPIFESVESEDKVENLLITVSTTDAEGRTAGPIQSGFSGAVRDGECRIYINGTTAVSSEELYDQAFERLDDLAVNLRDGREGDKFTPIGKYVLRSYLAYKSTGTTPPSEWDDRHVE